MFRKRKTEPDAPPPSPLTDQQLVELALRDDQSAYRELFRRYEEEIFSEAFQMVGDWDVADSIGQRAFVKAFRALDGYKPEFTFSGWLVQIARNVARDRLKKKNVTMESIDGNLDADTDATLKSTTLRLPARGASPLEQVVSMETDEELRHALTRLRPKYREAILLHVKQVPHAEIARRMGVPVNTVRTYVSRGRHELEKLCGTESQDESSPSPG